MLDRATASAVLPLIGALFGMGLLVLCTASLKRSFVAFRKMSPSSQMPEANWSMLGTNSLFWHDVTSNGSLRLTWQHALWNRVTNAPVSFQTELFPSGDFSYRYDFSLLPEGFWSNPPQYTIGYQNNGGGELWTNAAGAATVQLDWRGFGVLPDSATDLDGDGLGDYEELYEYGTDQTLVDSDGDGLSDAEDDFPNICDADGDGLPDGADEYAWQHNTLLAENAGYTNLVLTVVRGMAPAVRNAPQSGSALLQLGGLAIPLYEGATWNLGIPSGEWCDARLVVRDNLPVQLELSPGSTERPFYLDDPKGIFGSGTSANASARLAFPTLFLEPLSSWHSRCLHDGDIGVDFRAILHPMSWAENRGHAVLTNFMEQSDGTLWLEAPWPRSPRLSAQGGVTFGPSWLRWGTLSASDGIHWCEDLGYLCHACGTVHTEANACSHTHDCSARSDPAAECDCAPIFVRVNSDDNDCDGTQDRYQTPFVDGETDLVTYHAMGIGGCCCIPWNERDPQVRITSVSSGLRLWTQDGHRIQSGGIIHDTFFYVEAVSPTPAIGMGLVTYEILAEDGSVLRTITRRFTAANVQIRADLDDDGDVTPLDDLLADSGLGGAHVWKIARRSAPYRLSLQNECATYEGKLSLSLSGDAGVRVWQDQDALVPGATTNGPPFCVRNSSSTFWLDVATASNVNFIFICDSIGNLPGSVSVPTAFADNWLSDVNQIYRQASVSFSRHSCQILTNANCFSISIDPSTLVSQDVEEVVSLTTPCTGLKVYVVDSIMHGNVISYSALTYYTNSMFHGKSSKGVIIPSYMSSNSLAHEIGHACGLDDIYGSLYGHPYHTVTNVEPLTNLLTQIDFPADGTGASIFYPSGQMQSDLIRNLLMNGLHEEGFPSTDLPRGHVRGMSETGEQTMELDISVSDLNRAPVTY